MIDDTQTARGVPPAKERAKSLPLARASAIIRKLDSLGAFLGALISRKATCTVPTIVLTGSGGGDKYIPRIFKRSSSGTPGSLPGGWSPSTDPGRRERELVVRLKGSGCVSGLSCCKDPLLWGEAEIPGALSSVPYWSRDPRPSPGTGLCAVMIRLERLYGEIGSCSKGMLSLGS